MVEEIMIGTRADQSTPSSHAFPRYEQTFPTLTPQEIARVRRFGEPRSYRHGERLFETGKPGPGMFIVMSGHVAITQRDGFGHVTPIIDQGPGQFLAEIGQLSGRVALVDGHAEGDVETLLISPERLRALLVAEADLGERIMRALILRRVSLIRDGAGGPVLIGPSDSAGVIRLQGFLTRNGYPHHLLDPVADPDAAELIARYSPSQADWPLVVALDGAVLRNPSEAELARAMGMTGFLFPFEKLLPSHIFGILSLVLLAIACVALYVMKLSGAWRWIYVVTAMVALYLNVFVLVIQSFLKVGPLHALAPSVPPSEPPFAVVQGIVLVFFVVAIFGAARRFRPA